MCSLEESFSGQPILQDWGIMLHPPEGGVTIQLYGILLHKQLICFFTTINLFIHFYQCRLDIYLILCYNPLLFHILLVIFQLWLSYTFRNCPTFLRCLSYFLKVSLFSLQFSVGSFWWIIITVNDSFLCYVEPTDQPLKTLFLCYKVFYL